MIPYIINAGLILAGCLAFYKLLLQRETFYRLNRYVLVICIVTSFSLPLLPVPQQWSLRKAETVSAPGVPAVLPTGQQLKTAPVDTVNPPVQQTSNTDSTAAEPFTLRKALTWLMYLYWFGVVVFALSFLAQIAVLLYRAYTRPSIRDGKFRIVEVSGDKAPCSFANNIFINPGKYDWDTYNQILMHEKVHIMQGHTLDILLAEIVLIFQWFNPFAWIYRKEVENNLEFLTDDDLVQHKGLEMSSYQMSLLKVSAPHFPLSLTTNYNQSLLKKRIAMMNAKKSNVHTAWKYLFLLPLLVMFACLLNKPVAYGQREKSMRDNNAKNELRNHENDEISTEGVWFATIKKDKIYIRFKREGEDDDRSYNGTTFDLNELQDLPRNGTGSFSLTRDAGTMRFKGRFEGNEG
ncbi:MAG TPA: M56 family metallopeptidase, partial [Chitinophagaceae bacterium]|nr:M56 family metallopeptidase [Chitinophagaceae bacterium]